MQKSAQLRDLPCVGAYGFRVYYPCYYPCYYPYPVNSYITYDVVDDI